MLRGETVHVAIKTEHYPTAVPVGIIKQFGPVGEKYEVLGPIQVEGLSSLIKVRVLATGEVAEYELMHMMEDPEAR